MGNVMKEINIDWKTGEGFINKIKRNLSWLCRDIANVRAGTVNHHFRQGRKTVRTKLSEDGKDMEQRENVHRQKRP